MYIYTKRIVLKKKIASLVLDHLDLIYEHTFYKRI